MSTQLESDPTSVVGDKVEITYREAVNAALEDEMASDPRVYLLGEDVANDGGAFATRRSARTGSSEWRWGWR